MKPQKLANLGLSVSLSLVFIYFLTTEKVFSIIGLASVIGLFVELYYFLNFIKGGR